MRLARIRMKQFVPRTAFIPWTRCGSEDRNVWEDGHKTAGTMGSIGTDPIEQQLELMKILIKMRERSDFDMFMTGVHQVTKDLK